MGVTCRGEVVREGVFFDFVYVLLILFICCLRKMVVFCWVTWNGVGSGRLRVGEKGLGFAVVRSGWWGGLGEGGWSLVCVVWGLCVDRWL